MSLLPKHLQDPVGGPQSTEMLIRGLGAGGALTALQAKLLLEAWPILNDDWAASPYFKTVCEHTRAYIDQLRANGRNDSKALGQPKQRT